MICVLVVDDDPAVVEMLARMLERDGHTALRAGSAEEAAEILSAREHPVDVIVLDTVLPGMDGPAFARMVKAEPVHQHVRVIGISGLATVITEPAALPAGYDACLPKPIDVDVLVEAVRRAVNTKPS